MTTVLFSIPVHESNDTIRDTIVNVRRFAGSDHPIMLHVSAGWHGFDAGIAKLPNVHVNPRRWPTGHAHSQVPTHVSSFLQAEGLGLRFNRMVIMHTSELLIREGMSDHISAYDHSAWFTPDTQPRDSLWPPMNHVKQLAPGFDHYLGNLLEGSWYDRTLFHDMCAWIMRRWSLNDLMLPVALEESLFPTLAWDLTRGGWYAHPYCAFKHDQHFLSDRQFIEDIRAGRPVTFWQPHNFVYAYAPFPSQGIYSVKRIDRRVEDPMRMMVRQL